MAAHFNSFPSATALKTTISAALAENYRSYPNQKITQIKAIRTQLCYDSNNLMGLLEAKQLVESFWSYAEQPGLKISFEEYSTVLNDLIDDYYEEHPQEKYDYLVVSPNKTYIAKSEDEAKRVRDFMIDELQFYNVKIFKGVESL